MHSVKETPIEIESHKLKRMSTSRRRPNYDQFFTISNGRTSCPQELNMRYLRIPNVTLCYICIEPLLLLRSNFKFFSRKSHKGTKFNYVLQLLFPLVSR